MAVPRLPRISNFTDFAPLAREPGVRVRYVAPDTGLERADGVVLPGTKNTVDDLLALRDAGFGAELAGFDGPVVGICGGYQMLGERVAGAGVEGTGDRETVEGFGLLPVETRFSATKRVERVTRDIEVEGSGPLAGAAGEVAGYEIHMGETRALAPEAIERPVGPASAAADGVLGTYLHGLFENRAAREAFCASLFDAAGVDPPDPSGGEATARRASDPFDAAAALVTEHLDVEALLDAGVTTSP